MPDGYHMTPVGYAVISGSLLLAEVLLKGIDSNSDATLIKHLLLCAVRSGKSKMLRLVHKAVTEPCLSPVIRVYFSRLLKASVMLGLIKCSAALIEFGADPDTTLALPSSLWEEEEPIEPASNLGRTPLHLAVENDDGTMVNLLMEGGGDILKESYTPTLPILTNFTPTRHSHTSPSFKAITSLPPLCPLSFACVTAKERSVKAILTSRKFKADALVKAALHLHMQPLRACVLGNGGEGDKSLNNIAHFVSFVPIKKLNILANAKDLSGSPPLLEAAVTTSPDLVEMLIDECGADPNSTKSEESSAVKGYASDLKGSREGLKDLIGATEAARKKVRLSGRKFDESERENKVIVTKIEDIWRQANVLLEEQNVEKRRKGGKTTAVKQIQALAKLAKPPCLVLSKLSLAMCHVLGGGNLGATNPDKYDPSDTLDSPSWWGTFQRSARNLRIGSKMLAIKGTVIKDWKKVKNLCDKAGGAEMSSSRHDEASKSILTWCKAVTTEQECVASSSYSKEMIEYITSRESLGKVQKKISDLESLISAAPKTVAALNLALRRAPHLEARGYGRTGPHSASLRCSRLACSLIARGASVLSPDVDGETVLSVACRKQYWKVAKLAMVKGADVTGGFWGGECGMTRFGDKTPLAYACGAGPAALGADHARVGVIHELLVRGAQTTEECLVLAARQKDLQVVCILLLASCAVVGEDAASKYLVTQTASRKPEDVAGVTFVEKNCVVFERAFLPSSPPESVSVTLGTTAFPRGLEHCNYGSIDGPLSLISRLISPPDSGLLQPQQNLHVKVSLAVALSQSGDLRSSLL